jgi:DNA-binding transcriptional LysR family regulator
MRFEHLAEADLNLLVPLYALLEERQVTRAALRCGLSQPAMSRAFDRLRSTFGDELLVRIDGKFERTVRAERLLGELRDLLPRLDTVLRGDRFEPATSPPHHPHCFHRLRGRNFAAESARALVGERTADAGRRRALECRRSGDR